MKKQGIFVFAILLPILFVMGCSDDKGSNPPVTYPDFTNTTQPKDSDTESWNPGSACQEPPSKTVTIDIDEQYLDGGYFDNDRKIVGDIKSDSYFCMHNRTTDWKKLPELALIIGNQDGLNAPFGDLIRFLNHSWGSAVAGSHRHGCIYLASRANFERISKRSNVERIIIYGHGTEGNSVDSQTGELIMPEQIPSFKTTTLREVHFFSCQAGQKISDWERVLKTSSPNAKLDMSSDNIPVFDSLKSVSELMMKIWMCQI